MSIELEDCIEGLENKIEHLRLRNQNLFEGQLRISERKDKEISQLKHDLQKEVGVVGNLNGLFNAQIEEIGQLRDELKIKKGCNLCISDKANNRIITEQKKEIAELESKINQMEISIHGYYKLQKENEDEINQAGHTVHVLQMQHGSCTVKVERLEDENAQLKFDNKNYSEHTQSLVRVKNDQFKQIENMAQEIARLEHLNEGLYDIIPFICPECDHISMRQLGVKIECPHCDYEEEVG